MAPRHWVFSVVQQSSPVSGPHLLDETKHRMIYSRHFASFDSVASEISNMWSSLKDWTHKNKGKLGASAIFLAGVAGYLWYNPEHNPFSNASGDSTTATSAFSSRAEQNSGTAVAVEDDEWSPSRSSTAARSPSNGAQKAAAHRSRILLRVRKEFAVQAMQFLPLLHAKIVRVVDFDHAYDQLRELKRRRTAERNGEEGGDDVINSGKLDSNQLWEQIKDSSFTYLFVTAYIGSVLCTLLRIQLHIQARAMTNAGASASAAAWTATGAGAGDSSSEDFFDRMDSDVLKQLVNSTYTPLFGEGLRNLTAMVRSHVTRELSDWLVCDTNIMVEYAQLAERLSKIRKSCEASFPQLLASMRLLPPSEGKTPELNDGNGNATKAGGGADSQGMVSTLLAQTWDVVDSPLFSDVCTEAIDTCFRHISTKLRDKVFLFEPSGLPDTTSAGAGESSNSSNSPVMRTPPIASLLPQLKAIARDMLPAAPGAAAATAAAAANPKALSSSSALLTQEVRDIASGAALDTLCVAIFDAPGA